MRIEDLLRTVDPDVHRLVADAYRAHGQVTRNIIRDETRLRLQAPEDTREPVATDSTVPVRVDVAYPRAHWLEIPPEVELAAKLARWAPTLHSLATSGRAADSMLRQLGPQLSTVAEINGLLASPSDAARLAEVLLQLAGRFDLVRHILEVDEDVLGVYRPQAHFDGRPQGIELYWGVIGLVAEVLGVPVQALTLVVLAHELAHAYTHLGYDIDGVRGDIWFGSLDRTLCESLAQYYTARASTRLDARVPGTRRAYELLVEKQPSAYRGHLPWIEEKTPEGLRGAILVARRNSVRDYSSFDELLHKTSRRLRRGGLDSE
jgi:hypothetical protein